MSVLSGLIKIITFKNTEALLKVVSTASVVKRSYRPFFLEKPVIGRNKSYRRIVHFPEKYTIEPLNITNLGGRDPATGRVAVNGIGGGIKHKYHWIKWLRDGPTDEGPPQLEKVLEVLKCGCRTADVALVAVGDKLKYILATANMKRGDIIKTSRFLAPTTANGREGDAYPLGSLPVGAKIHNVEMWPESSLTLIHSAGCCGIILRHLKGKVVVKMPNKHEYAFDSKCVATIGQLSNASHGSTHIGTAARNRELGNRPRSGWWQRKGGQYGRKIKPLPPLKEGFGPKEEPEIVRLTLDDVRP